MTEFLHGELTYYLRGVGFRVHNALHGGHEEKVYEETLSWVFDQDKVVYWRQRQYRINYKGKQIGEFYPDFMLAGGKVTLDLKSALEIEALHKAQVISYMAVTNANLGILMNFGTASLQTARLPNFLSTRKPLQWQPSVSADNLYPELTNQILHCLHIVHHELGPGFLHQVYRRATRIELRLHFVNFVYLKELPLCFEGHSIAKVEIRLLWIEQKLLLATIAVTEVTEQHKEKMRWAMQEVGCQLGMIANFYPNRLDVTFLRR